MGFICLFLSSAISTYIDYKNKNEKSIYLIIKYLLYTFINALLMNTFIYVISSEKFYYYREATYTYDFCLKYMWLSLIIALILPYILQIIERTFDISIEIKGKKNNEKNK